jgi:hypothetical protein
LPPAQFAAYGIVAFPQTATSDTLIRYQSACEAYLATLPSTSSVAQPLAEQMVTIWPVRTSALASELAGIEDPIDICKRAVGAYDLTTSLTALEEASRSSSSAFGGRGPYLLAWAPSSAKGKQYAIVLVADLSSAEAPSDFIGYFRAWRNSIEEDQSLWNKDGWSVERMRVTIKIWSDTWGPRILSAVGIKG